MIARGSLGNPWIFAELTGARDGAAAEPTRSIAELRWVIDRAAEHWGAERARRNLRKFYPWYLERLGIEGADADALPAHRDLDEVSAMLDALVAAPVRRLSSASGRRRASL